MNQGLLAFQTDVLEGIAMEDSHPHVQYLMKNTIFITLKSFQGRDLLESWLSQ